MHPLPGALLAVAAAALAVALAPGADAQAVIDNGVVRLGVNVEGDLVVNTQPIVSRPTPGIGGITGGAVGLQFIPTGGESTAQGCACEAWGASYGTTTGYTRSASAGLGAGVLPVSFVATPSTAISTTRVGDLTVIHSYEPSTLTPYLYRVNVTLRNDGSTAMPDLRYRRAMDWDIDPTPFSEYVTIDRNLPLPTSLTFSSDNGFATGDPLTPAGSIVAIGPPMAGPFYDSGPNDHGAVFDLNFGILLPGAMENFTTYYGAAPTEADAQGAIDAVQAQVWTFGQPNGGQVDGMPNTFIWGFGYLEIIPPPPPPPPPPVPPTASFVYSIGDTCEDSALRVIATASDIDGTVDSYTLDLGTGPVQAGAWTGSLYAEHTYAAAGTYIVRLEVTDSDGLVAGFEEAVFSVGDPVCCPRLNTLTDVTLQEGQFLRLQGTHFDFEDDPARYTVDFLPVRAAFTPAGELTWQTAAGEAGIYRLRIHVTEDGPQDPPCDDAQVISILILGFPPGSTLDTDLDGVADSADNCPGLPNEDQADGNHDGRGDACQDLPDAAADGLPARRGTPGPGDIDGDGVADAADTCPAVADSGQGDLDQDGRGDLCDDDLDGDGIPQLDATGAIADNCPLHPNPTQADRIGDGLGDACRGIILPLPRGVAAHPANVAAGLGAAAPTSWQDMAWGLLMGAVSLAAVGVGTVAWARSRWK